MRKPAPRERRGQKARARPARPSSSFASDREELLSLLLRDGVLHESPAQPAPAVADASTPWRLDSLRVTLSSRGAELAGRCLLHLLERFEGHQLATFGTAGVPLLQSCILLSGGRYQGLLVPQERGPDGELEAVEGKIDPNEPVIIIDDAASSVDECRARLEEAGLFVEGGVCLVRFVYDGIFSRMLARGYPVVALYDIWEDFVPRMSDADPLARNPTRVLPPHEPSAEAAPEGLHPAELARRVMAEALRTGKLLRPPRRVQGRYSGAGGVWVHVRSKEPEATPALQARAGFWCFPDEKVPSLPVAIAQAAFLAAQELSRAGAEPLAALERSAITVTLSSALEECGVRQLDTDRYGIVVRSRERPSLMGGAPPRMAGIAHEGQQLQHARIREARLLPWEPFILYRHEVQEAPEPGTSPLPAEGAEPVLPGGAPPKSLAEGVARLTPPLCKFLLRHLGETARYNPFSDVAHPGLDTAQMAHQAWSIARAYKLLGPAPLGEGARTLITALTSDLVFDEDEHIWIHSEQGPSISEAALVLLALLETGDDPTTASALAGTLWSSIGAHGRFHCYMDRTIDDEAAQDSAPGLALLALARAAEEKVAAPDAAKLAQARRYYRHHFRHKYPGSQVSWLAQAAVAWWRVDRDAEAARLAFEICDHALEFQSEKTGAFLDERSPDDLGDPTAHYLEALSAASGLAAGLRDRARQQRYLKACTRGVAFLDSLVIQERDAARVPNPRQALGGVLASPEQGEIRMSLVQHTLMTLLGLREQSAGGAGAKAKKGTGAKARKGTGAKAKARKAPRR
jgi:orotate phosphoribosyltransferase